MTDYPNLRAGAESRLEDCGSCQGCIRDRALLAALDLLGSRPPLLDWEQRERFAKDKSRLDALEQEAAP